MLLTNTTDSLGRWSLQCSINFQRLSISSDRAYSPENIVKAVASGSVGCLKRAKENLFANYPSYSGPVAIRFETNRHVSSHLLMLLLVCARIASHVGFARYDRIYL
jgi:hypothetical protein